MTEHTFSLTPGSKPPATGIADMEWFAGSWRGEAFGGISDEIWSPPSGGAMMGMYRLVREGKPVFYELMTIVEENGSLVLRLKHFNPNLTGWEEKEKTVDFAYIGKDADARYFEGMTFRSEGRNAATIFLAIKSKDGTIREEAFHYERMPSETVDRS